MVAFYSALKKGAAPAESLKRAREAVRRSTTRKSRYISARFVLF
jgi:hypothetical protein